MFNFVLASAAMVVLAAPADAQVTRTDQGASAPFVYGGVLVPAPVHDRFSDHVDWATTPTRTEVVGVMPADVTSAGRTLWSCAIKGDGHLEDCRLQKSWPAKEGFGRAARNLMPDFQLSAPTTGAAALNHSRVVFEIDIFNDLLGIKDIPGTCPVEFCPITAPHS